MKKILTLGMIMLMAFAMIGCGKSEPAEAPEEAANEIEVEVPEEDATEDVAENPLVGKTFESTDETDPRVWTFNEDGTMVQQSGDITTNGTYTVEGNVAQVEMEGVTVPVNIDGDTLTYEFGERSSELKLKE